MFKSTDSVPQDRLTNGDADRARDRDKMNAFSDSDVPTIKPTVVLISPNESSLRSVRRALEAQRATVLKEFTTYPSYAHLEAVLEIDCDALVVELDTDMDIALEVVETVCARKPLATVMVYARAADTEAMARAMRAGAREYLTGAIANTLLQEALLRAAARRLEQMTKRTSGKTMVFWGAKGGSG